MAMIEVDFEVYKALTARRATESVTYNDVIRDLLNLKAARPKAASPAVAAQSGALIKGVFFPNKTEFRATHKGRTFMARIEGGVWVDSSGKVRTSPSEAAIAITGKNWNGWRFWSCRRPGESSWTLLNDLREPPHVQV
jgi:hypothetical protein